MKLKIFEKDLLIGEATVFGIDPGMCVATANFEPTDHYIADRHANIVNGDYVGDRSDNLRIEMSNGRTLKSEAIAIQDFAEIEEREVNLIGIYEPSFDELFSKHPDFNEYWQSR
ncbi:hypothetical protein [Qipengyuania sp.]|uniref:hypothetical protein n=1 Tax=Qipengyuania sp. TaxID=2004515 RepID=UPI003AF50817